MEEYDRETALILAAHLLKETAEMPESEKRNSELRQLAEKVTELAGVV